MYVAIGSKGWRACESSHEIPIYKAGKCNASGPGLEFEALWKKIEDHIEFILARIVETEMQLRERPE